MRASEEQHGHRAMPGEPALQQGARDRMNAMPRLRSLTERHETLESRISQEATRPMPDAETLGRLKRDKLRLKEEIERLRQPQR